MDQTKDKRLLGVEGQTETRKRKTHALEINQKELFTLFHIPPPFFFLYVDISVFLAFGHYILGHLTLCQFFLASFQEDQGRIFKNDTFQSTLETNMVFTSFTLLLLCQIFQEMPLSLRSGAGCTALTSTLTSTPER